jgi:hypothetical protein
MMAVFNNLVLYDQHVCAKVRRDSADLSPRQPGEHVDQDQSCRRDTL